MAKYQAYWVSPYGKVSGVTHTHISDVVSNPKRFGMTEKHIKELYKKYNEKLNLEGKAREKLLLDVMKRGWIRIREHHRGTWTIQTLDWTRRTKNNIFNWVIDVIDDGASKFDSVNIITPRNTIRESLVGLLKNNILEMNNYTASEIFKINNKVSNILELLKKFK